MESEADIVERIQATDERVHISVGAVCNNNCIFCMEEDREARVVNNSAMTPERVRWALETERGAREVCFTSGEPTTREDLPDFIAWAKELGYPRISMMTNGRRLSHLPYAKVLARRGLNRVYVSIHGHERALHEGMTRAPGSFEQTVSGLDNVARLERQGVELHTSTVVTRRNLAQLGDIYRFLRSHGVHQVVFNVMQPNGRAHTFFDRLFPHYSKIAAVFRDTLASLDEARPMAFLVDIPLCVTDGVPDFNRGFVERHRQFDLESQVTMPVENREARRGEGKGQGLLMLTRADLDRARRSKREECARCRYDSVCEGVWDNYLSRFGWDELSPVGDEPGCSCSCASSES